MIDISLLRNKSVLICGNGPSLDKDFENLNIGDYEYVLRMNNWEPNHIVGARCDIWGTTFWYDITKENILRYRDKIVFDCMWFGGCFQYEQKHWNEISYLMSRKPDFYLKKSDFNFFREKVIKIPSPSTGMYMIYMCLKLKMNITVAGFDCFVGHKHHYFSNESLKLTRDITPHRGKIEKEWLRKMEHEGNLKII